MSIAVIQLPACVCVLLGLLSPEERWTPGHTAPLHQDGEDSITIMAGLIALCRFSGARLPYMASFAGASTRISWRHYSGPAETEVPATLGQRVIAQRDPEVPTS